MRRAFELELRVISHRVLVLLVLMGCTAISAGVAVAVSADPFFAVLGSLLVVAYWLLELLTLRLAEQGSFSNALVAALGGMVLRMGLVVGALILIGVLAREEFATAALAFLGTFTVYIFLRLYIQASGDGRMVTG